MNKDHVLFFKKQLKQRCQVDVEKERHDSWQIIMFPSSNPPSIHQPVPSSWVPNVLSFGLVDHLLFVGPWCTIIDSIVIIGWLHHVGR